MLKSTVVLLGTVAGNGQDLLNCLQDSSGTGCSVHAIDSSTGIIETPHPYESNKLYMFEVASPSASQSFTFSFTEFEVDIDNDGTCLDEVYIFADDATLGPFCGFDNAFFVDANNDNTVTADESNEYDYYYSELLNTNNLSENAKTGLSVSGPIRIGLKTGATVNNYGFKVLFTINDIADPCRAITAAASSTPPAEYAGCTVVASTDFPRSTFLEPMNAVCRGGCTGDSGTCPIYTNIFSAGTTVTTCASCKAQDLKERRQLLKCPTDTGHPEFVHTSFHAADACACAP